MDKDLDSFVRHETTYHSVSQELVRSHQDEMEKQGYFAKHGFKRALDENPKVRALHIDIGSGAGWMLRYTAPFFKKVIALEPSVKATEFAREYNREFSNIEYVNSDMLEYLLSLNLTEPYFVTTSIVFSHIKEFHVANTLAVIDRAPVGSVLLFNEPYDKNVQQPFWRIYNQAWWRKNLPNWDLKFLGVQGTNRTGKNDNYLSGIYGVRRGRANGSSVMTDSFQRRLWWFVSGCYYKIRYSLVRTAKFLLGIKS